MRQKDFILEAPYSTIEQIKPALQMIESKCKQILSAYLQRLGVYLYHGTKRKDYYYMASTVEHRSPKDTEITDHHAITSIMKAAGLKATRSNSIFTTSNFEFAEYYGNTSYGMTYIIFPIDGFNFTWSSMIRDYYLAGKRGEINYDEADPMGSIVKLGYRANNLPAAIKSKNEVMISGSYIGIDTRFEKYITNWIISL